MSNQGLTFTTLMLVAAALGGQTHTHAATIGSDDAGRASYVASGWFDGQNDGVGFGPWKLLSDATGGGFAGFYSADNLGGVDNIGVEQTPPLPYANPAAEGRVWASYANKGDGIDRATAFRSLDESLDGLGDSFSVSYEHGFVNGAAGVALRTANISDLAEDYDAGARAQFQFSGGNGVYALIDDAGTVELDGSAGLPFVPFTFFGVDLTYTMTGPDTYDLQITKYNAEAGSGGSAPDVFNKTTHPALGGRSLAGTGTIDSVALYQEDVEKQSDGFFNNLNYTTSTGNGADNAANYFGLWFEGDNFGNGFGPWVFTSETDGGFAGNFIQAGAGNGVDNAGTPAPDGSVWASYANQGNFADKAVQYRNLNHLLGEPNDTFSVSLENGYVDPGGRVGISLLDGSVQPDVTPDDYASNALFQFFFEGGNETYTLIDASGEIDTGVNFSFWGVDLDLVMTGIGTFDLTITRYGEPNDAEPEITTLSDLTLATTPGTGMIGSLAFVNVDAPNQSDVFWNHLTYATDQGGGLEGDFNNDGIVDDMDIDLLRENLGDPAFDLDGNGVADADDMIYIVETIIGSRLGDANLDRTVDLLDLSALASNFNSAAGWAGGNFNTDAAVDLLDLSILAASFGQSATVPEPGAAVLLTLGLAGVARRKHG
ncbi:hypothetical protein [Mucisphaera calidilacus]|uniref:PEP-CTERM protein-sorting domain-containing protein n=1 Tax=Mucisphaera calidilacus TaxID=2527982 RepID=A0A518BU37_9BACT|nr:hypothetical protein [Mucisphaera calidilacus]QDU70498.1 hypothetical protein Pan265_03260 [Mucisphaera calidilacus]